MKIRLDFVTNSSSSFVLARNAEWNEKQKEEILWQLRMTCRIKGA